MSSYFVDFTAYIDENKRPENFPHQVHVQETYENVESIPHLQFLVNNKFLDLVKAAGLVVLKNQDEIMEEGKITFDRRIFVPWHMITYMKLDVHHIAEKDTTDNISPSSQPEKSKKGTVN